MFNLIKMNFRRMLQMKSFYVTSVLAIIFPLFVLIVNKIDMHPFVSDVFSLWSTLFTSGFILVLTTVFTALFVSIDFTSGYIKNLVGQTKNRFEYVLAKAFTVIVYNIFIFILSFGVIAGFSAVFADKIKWGSFSDYVQYGGTCLLVYLAVCMFIMLITFIFRTSGFPCTFSILISTGFLSSMFFSLLNLLLNHFEIDFDTFNLSISNALGLVSEATMNSSDIPAKAFITTGVYFVGSIALSCLHYTKKDI